MLVTNTIVYKYLLSGGSMPQQVKGYINNEGLLGMGGTL